LLNASVGLQRVFGRRQPTQRTTSTVASRQDDVYPGSDSLRIRVSNGQSVRSAAPARRVRSVRRFSVRSAMRGRVGPEALLPMIVVLIVVVATYASWAPAASNAAVGGPDGDAAGPRLAVSGFAGAGAGGNDGSGPTADGAATADTTANSANLIGITGEQLGGPRSGDPSAAGAIRGPFLQDGTLVKPMAVNTSIADGAGLLKKYKVRGGETLTGIAHRFGVSVKTILWANKLPARSSVHAGQTLTIPPVDGVVVTVAEGDTLDSIAASYEVDPQAIYDLNGLEDSSLVLGQTLILPGAVGTTIPSERVTKPKPPVQANGGGSGGGNAGNVRPPATYGGGKMAWPVIGGHNFISQYFHAGHYAIDIAADYGTRVGAAAGGTVIFAGWKANGGGYQVWIAHGSGIFTTYNHMSAITVGTGQSVGRGTQVGRIGQTGNATGPHLHFEVWRGPVWDGGTRVNPLGYL
jgi:murein DD-endopeptidase MepM/ murein hydrolase activator NlpD